MIRNYINYQTLLIIDPYMVVNNITNGNTQITILATEDVNVPKRIDSGKLARVGEFKSQHVMSQNMR